LGIPKKGAWKSVLANGSPVWNRGAFLAGTEGVSEAGEDSLYIKFNVGPGTWRFLASLVPVGIAPPTGPGMPTFFSVTMRESGTAFALAPEFAGKAKTVEVFDISGAQLRRKT